MQQGSLVRPLRLLFLLLFHCVSHPPQELQGLGVSRVIGAVRLARADVVHALQHLRARGDSRAAVEAPPGAGAPATTAKQEQNVYQIKRTCG